MHTLSQLESPKRRDHSEDPGVDGRIILEWIQGNRLGIYGLDSFDSGQGHWEYYQRDHFQNVSGTHSTNSVMNDKDNATLD